MRRDVESVPRRDQDRFLPDHRLRVVGGTPAQELDGETFLYHGPRRQLANLRGLETELWRLIDRPEGAVVVDLWRYLCEHFDVPPQTAWGDVQDFVGQLVDFDLVEAPEAPHPRAPGAHA